MAPKSEYSYLAGPSSIPSYGMPPSRVVQSLRRPQGFGGPQGIQPLTPQFNGAPLTGGPTLANAEATFGAPMDPLTLSPTGMGTGSTSYGGGVSPVSSGIYPASPTTFAASSLAPETSPRPKNNPNIADTAKAGGGKFWGEDGFNIGDVGTIADVIGGFGSIWSGIQANKLAKEEMALQKQAYQTNLASSISSYNLALEDRMRARYTQTDRSQAEASAYIDANRLKA